MKRQNEQKLRLRQRLAALPGAKNELGMTLIEIMIVVAIISLVLGGVSIVAFNQLKKANVSTAKNDTIQIESAVEMYRAQKRNKCPKTLEDLKAAGVLSRVPNDPWGNPYEFKCPGTQSSIDVISSGEDGQMGTADDIANYKDLDEDEPEQE